MTTISADLDTLMRQAAMTAHQYYIDALRDLPDDVAPEIIAAYMQAASQDLAASITAKILEETLDSIRGSLDAIAENLVDIGPDMISSSADAETIASANSTIAEAIQNIAAIIDLHS